MLNFAVCAAVACAPVPPLFGHLADVYGSEYIMSPMFAIAIPLFLFLRSDSSLPAFIVFYALAGKLRLRQAYIKPELS